MNGGECHKKKINWHFCMEGSMYKLKYWDLKLIMAILEYMVHCTLLSEIMGSVFNFCIHSCLFNHGNIPLIVTFCYESLWLHVFFVIQIVCSFHLASLFDGGGGGGLSFGADCPDAGSSWDCAVCALFWGCPRAPSTSMMDVSSG